MKTPPRGSRNRWSASCHVAIACGSVRHHIHFMGSYESCLAALNEIIARYRAGLTGERSRVTLSCDQAIQLIKALGFTAGDAMRWLDAKAPRP